MYVRTHERSTIIAHTRSNVGPETVEAISNFLPRTRGAGTSLIFSSSPIKCAHRTQTRIFCEIHRFWCTAMGEKTVLDAGELGDELGLNHGRSPAHGPCLVTGRTGSRRPAWPRAPAAAARRAVERRGRGPRGSAAQCRPERTGSGHPGRCASGSPRGERHGRSTDRAALPL